MNSNRPPFKLMRATVAMLQGALLPMLTTLKVESLDADDLKLVTTIVFAHEHTTKQLKNNPSRAKLLVLCAAWYRLADRSLTLISDQPTLTDALKAVIQECEWVAQLNPNMRVAEEASI